ncbi:hypothetical protein AT571_08180 [Acinetobacter baumannii]|jgi:hypothetical protein|uniref:Uncharacterized protein n=1 Tax=Acinetobacter baumannii TaxID=470 RepID=A0A0H4UG96_ACIBA|nr:hypothetical protein ACX60_18400 [Acinetobacter baumannii]EJP48363.1 hypothetical protein ACINNAV18_A0096 [Acinetobacter baumannii Naval-18]ENW32653.1 hypothetical protein F921_03875 [Acinetobacter baumannii NIPH 527]QDQ51910.1 hypothetical protein E5A71_08180 [Acinetobacter baumannii ATCC 17978]RQL53461.1 hypothetical protein BJI56_19465 [Acinetobacter nosocomialis]RSF51968.1 hypothetical protein EGS71_01125 [Acinetobacter sp. FDAARGOS_559]CAH1090806.1 Uncharacterised protein [Acinetobact
MKSVMQLGKPKAEKSIFLSQLLCEYENDPTKFKIISAPVDTSQLNQVYRSTCNVEVKCIKKSK